MNRADRFRVAAVILGLIALIFLLQYVGLAAPPAPAMLTPPIATMVTTPEPQPGGNVIYTGTTDGVVLHFNCAEGSPKLEAVGVEVQVWCDGGG